MNYFAHGRSFVDHPCLLAGTALPDWLNVVDRRARIRSRTARRYLQSRDQRVVCLAAGVLRHLRDDDWFHRTRAFSELCLEFTASLRSSLPSDTGFRPSFLAHLLVEVLLDWHLIESNPRQLERYYQACDALDPEFIAWVVGQMVHRPLTRMVDWIPRFSAERFLYDYGQDAKLLFRLNLVLRRVQLAPVPDELIEWLPLARQRVRQRWPELLDLESVAPLQ